MAIAVGIGLIPTSVAAMALNAFCSGVGSGEAAESELAEAARTADH